MKQFISSVGLVSLMTFCLVARAAAQPNAGKAKVKVELLSSVEAVSPGQPFDLALSFRIQPHWHIYWKHAGDAGLPPRVTWSSVPEGFDIGPMQFPVPKRHIDAGGLIVTNVHEDEPVLLMTVTPPKSIAADKVVFEGKVNYLVCEVNCLPGFEMIKLELPVTKSGEPKPANAELFVRAHRQLPRKESKQIKISPAFTSTDFSKNDAALEIPIEIAEGFKIQSNTPLQEAFIATDVFMEPTDGLIFKKAEYPPHQLRAMAGLGDVAEFSGKIKVRIPVEATGEPVACPVRAAGVIVYQACDKKGTCLPPDSLQFSLETPCAKTSDTATTKSDELQTGDGKEKAPPTVVADSEDANKPTTISGATTSTGPASGGGSTTAATEPAKREGQRGGIEGFLRRLGLFGLFIGCFLYGLSINATPCVLPLLSIKVLGFVQQAHESRAATLKLALSFGAGVILFFIVLGLLAASGRNILQYPSAVIALSTIVLAMALSMLGVYTLQAPAAASNLEARIRREGPLASFGKGALAPVLGFACTGPLLAAAFGWATLQPRHIAIFAFLLMGLGMASPYILMGANPKMLSFLPRPGNWMITFERIMGFLLLAMVAWLLYPLAAQLGATTLLWTMVFLVAVAFACWLLGKVDFSTPEATRWRYRGGAGVTVVLAALLIFGWFAPLRPSKASNHLVNGGSTCLNVPGGSALCGMLLTAYRPVSGCEESEQHINWLVWSEDAVRHTVDGGRIVFVDFTAAYCTVCKVNKRIAIETIEFHRKLNELGVIAFEGDFSNGDPDIFRELQRHERAGVPLNLIYPAGRPDEPIVLDPNLTKEYLIQKLEEAARLSNPPQLGRSTIAQVNP